MSIRLLTFLIIFHEQTNLFIDGFLSTSVDFSILILNLIAVYVCFKKKILTLNKYLFIIFFFFLTTCLLSYIIFKNFDGLLSLVKLSFYFLFALLFFSILEYEHNLKIFLNFTIKIMLIICVIYIFIVAFVNVTPVNFDLNFLKVYNEHGLVRVALIFNEPLLMSLYFSLAATFSVYLHYKKSFVLFFLGTVLTFSMTGLFLVFTLLFFFLIKRLSIKQFMILGTIFIVSFFYLIFTLFADRLNSILLLTDGSTRIRIASAYASIMMFLENPLFGVGFGNSKFLIEDYSGLFKSSFQHIDLKPANGYFLLLSEIGLIGFFIFFISNIFSIIRHKNFCAPLVIVCVYFISSAIMLLPIIFVSLIVPMLMSRSNFYHFKSY